MQKFLCDQMCQELGRWLRIAGYDTAVITTALPDKLIFQKAVEEQRLLLTRDKHFLELDPQQTTVFYLHGESLDAWAQQLKKHVNWLYNPFSRCLLCNTPFDQIEKELWYCPTCRKTYWLGSHTSRMHHRLTSWQTIIS